MSSSPSTAKNSPVISTKDTFGESSQNGEGNESSPEHTQVTYIDKPVKNEVEAGSENGTEVTGENGDDEEEKVNGDRKETNVPISAIKFEEEVPTSSSSDGQYNPEELNRFSAPADFPRIRTDSEYLTKKLQSAMETVAPLLREIITDFKSYLQKTLLGTHGQEIMNDVKVLQTLRNQQGSVIELVMLLCSQEWQTSLQRHAGLAFIELVNEGRLMAHATRDHVLRVANEADFILNRLRAEDVSKHASFDHESLEQLNNRKKEDQVADHLIISSRRRDQLTAAKSLEKMRTILMSPSGAWCTNDEEELVFVYLKISQSKNNF